MVAIFAATVSAGMMFGAQTHLSPVNDEPANLPSGYVFMKTGRYVDATHPPLIRYVMAVPLLFQDPSPLPDDDSALRDWHSFGRAFLFGNRVSWKTMLWSARSAIIVLSMGCTALVFVWARRLWGPWPAAFGTVFLAFEPTFMGHGALATLDQGSSLLFFATIAAFWRYRMVPGKGRFALFAVLLALALVSKFSLAILIVAVPVAGLVAGRVGEAPRARVRVLIVAASIALVTSAAYGFQSRSMAEDPQIIHHREAEAVSTGIGRVAKGLGTDRKTLMNLRIPLYDLVKGAGLQVFHAVAQDAWEDADFYQYLNGDYSRNGWRTYYLWTLILKSTMPTLLLVGALIVTGGVRVLRGRRCRETKGRKPATWPFLVIPPIIYFTACSAATINIGHRYILPIYPFIAMGAAYLFSRTSGRTLKTVMIVMLASHAGSSTNAYPHFISYFNEVAGGRLDGHLHLADSNLDWGQDLLYLRDDVSSRRAAGVAVYGSVFGTVRPKDLGFELAPIPRDPGSIRQGGPVTIYLSLNRWLLRSRLHPDGLHPWLAGRVPDRRIGSSILAFDFVRYPVHGKPYCVLDIASESEVSGDRGREQATRAVNSGIEAFVLHPDQSLSGQGQQVGHDFALHVSPLQQDGPCAGRQYCPCGSLHVRHIEDVAVCKNACLGHVGRDQCCEVEQTLAQRIEGRVVSQVPASGSGKQWVDDNVWCGVHVGDTQGRGLAIGARSEHPHLDRDGICRPCDSADLGLKQFGSDRLETHEPVPVLDGQRGDGCTCLAPGLFDGSHVAQDACAPGWVEPGNGKDHRLHRARILATANWASSTTADTM